MEKLASGILEMIAKTLCIMAAESASSTSSNQSRAASSIQLDTAIPLAGEVDAEAEVDAFRSQLIGRTPSLKEYVANGLASTRLLKYNNGPHTKVSIPYVEATLLHISLQDFG